MFVTECKADCFGHQIVARNSFGPTFSLKSLTGENRLYIDGEPVDKNTDLFALSSAPIMRGKIVENGKVHIVEVFARSGWLRVKLRIHVDGQKVAGEDF
jgi:hypothetical protein